MNTRFMILVLSVLTLLAGCRRDFSAIDTPALTLTVEDVGVTEAWLRLDTKNGKKGDRITVSRNDSVIWKAKAADMDSLIYDSGLLPNHDYTYTASLSSRIQNQASRIQITTMDTTSHDFTWQTWTWGAKGSSLLYDVAIINENDIWAVGEIYTEDSYTWDSLGNWIQPYNAVHWDGNEWELKRVLFEYNGNLSWAPIKSILAFNENDVWFEAGIHWNGEEFETRPLNIPFPSHVNKMWGTSSEDLYIVGNNGLIAHYDGDTWQQIESGTDLDLRDIWSNPLNEKELYITASKNEGDINGQLLRLNPDFSITEIFWPHPTRSLTSVWFNQPSTIFLCGDGVYRRDAKGTWKEFFELPLIFTRSIRAKNINDIFVCGDFGLMAHFNGLSWKVINNTEADILYSIKLENDTIIAIGRKGIKAFVIILRRG